MVKNLVDNAIRYTPESGRVDLSVETTGGTVTLTIADTGPGIPEEERVRVYDAFYRVLGTNETGSGLGLSIVKATSTRLGATVHLGYSDPQQKTGLRVQIVFSASARLLVSDTTFRL